MAALYASFGLLSGLLFGWYGALWRRKAAGRDPIRKHPRGMQEADPYRLQPAVLSRAESALYRTLTEVMPEGRRLLVKVRLADLLQVTYGAGDRGEAHARVGNKVLDFLICDADLSPEIAIAVEGIAADRSDAQSRTFVARVCSKVGLPLVRIPIAAEYETSEVERLISPYLSTLKVAA